MSKIPNVQQYRQLMSKTLSDYKTKCDTQLNKQIYAEYLSVITTALQQNLVRGGSKVIRTETAQSYYNSCYNKHDIYEFRCIKPEIIQHKVIDDLFAQGYIGTFYTRDDLYISPDNEFKRNYTLEDHKKIAQSEIDKNIYYIKLSWQGLTMLNDSYLSSNDELRFKKCSVCNDFGTLNSEGVLTMYGQHGTKTTFNTSIRDVMNQIL